MKTPATTTTTTVLAVVAVLAVAASAANKNAIHSAIREICVHTALRTDVLCVYLYMRAFVRCFCTLFTLNVFLEFRKQNEFVKRRPVNKYCKPILFSFPPLQFYTHKRCIFSSLHFFCSLISILEIIRCTKNGLFVSLTLTLANRFNYLCINANKAKQTSDRVSE